MDYLDSFADHDIPEYGKEGEDGRKSRLAVDDEKWHVIDLEAICEMSYACSASVGMSDDNHLVAAIDEFLCSIRMCGLAGVRIYSH